MMPPLDEELLAGILQGHIHYAIAQQERFKAAGETPPITEDSDHNRFLWLRIRYPGFFRYVAKSMETKVHQDRIDAIVAAVATSALRERPTMTDWAKAMGEDRRNSTVARYQQRVVTEYLPDVIRATDDAHLADQRMRAFTTSFDPVPGRGLPALKPDGFDADEWKRAPTTKFRDIVDWANVSASLLCVYPEQLRVWLLTAKAVARTAKALEATAAANTITDPFAVSILANHAASICADSWWAGRSAQRQQEMFETPRVFDYTDEAAREAGRLWNELAKLNPRWGEFGAIMLQRAALGLQRWGAAGQAGVLVRTAATMDGLREMRRGAMISDAGYAFRIAGRSSEAVEAYRAALDLLDRSPEPYHRVIIRINCCEALRGPANNPAAAALLAEAKKIAGSDPRCLGGFWRNCSTMFHRLGQPDREEACGYELLRYPDALPDGGVVLNQRLLELHRENARRKPIDGEAAILP